MNHDERMLHDYLDDRLAPDERARFERRLREQPELAERVASYRALGETLRAELSADEPLGDVFYDRARRRYTCGSSGESPSRRFGLISWEAAGLAVAAILAVTLFVPPLIDSNGGRLAPGPAIAEPVRSTEAEPRAEGLASDRSVVPQDAAADAPSIERPEPVREQKAREPEPVAGGRITAPTTERSAADRPRRDTVAKKETVDADERFAAAPAPAAPVLGKVQRDTSGVPPDVGALAESEDLGSVVRVPRIALPNDSRPRRALDEFVGREWLARLDGADGERLARLGAPAPGERLVLVGGVSSSSACDALRVEELAVGWRVSVATVAAGERGVTCALRLPDDGRPVALDD